MCFVTLITAQTASNKVTCDVHQNKYLFTSVVIYQFFTIGNSIIRLKAILQNYNKNATDVNIICYSDCCW